METSKATFTPTPVKTMKNATANPIATGKQDAVLAISQWLDKGDELDRCCACRSLGALSDCNSVSILADHLIDEDIDVCIDAAEALGRIGDRRAVTPLVESLRSDSDGDVKTVIVEALGQLGGEQAISQLLELAVSPPEDDGWDDDEGWDSNWDVQIEAVQALGELQVAAAVDPLSKLLDDDECQVDKSNLFNSLAHIGGAGEQLLIQHLKEDTTRERRRAARALGLNCSANGVRALGRALQDSEAEVRTAAIDAIASGGHDQYLNAFLILLHDASSQVRETALKAVDKLTSVHATAKSKSIELEKLLPLLDDNSPQVRAAVLNTLHGRLEKQPNEYIQNRTLVLLNDSNIDVVAAACPLAALLSDTKSEQTLLSLTKNPQGNSAVRQQAIIALGQRGNVSASVLETLTEVLGTQDTVLIFAALQALLALHTHNKTSGNDNEVDKKQITPLEIILTALLGDSLSPELTKPEQTVSKPQNGELTENEKDTADKLDSVSPDIEPLKTELPISTLDAIALGKVELARQLETNKALNPDDIPELPAAEMKTFQTYYDILEQQKYNRKKFTVTKTNNIDNQVRRLSARILGECSQPEVVAALAQTIHDEDPEIQREAIDALARLTPPTLGISEILGPLTSFLHLGNVDLRVVSARALGALGNLDTLSSLTECLEDENQLVRSQMVVSVGQLLKSHATVSTNIINSLHSANVSVANKRAKQEAASVEHALHSLVKRLDDTDVGVRKATALAISELNNLISSEEFRDEIIQHLINAGFYGAGEQARDMGAALRTLDPAVAGDRLIPLLDNLPSSIERRFAMEMLEEVFKPTINKNTHLL